MTASIPITQFFARKIISLLIVFLHLFDDLSTTVDFLLTQLIYPFKTVVFLLLPIGDGMINNLLVFFLSALDTYYFNGLLVSDSYYIDGCNNFTFHC